MVSYCIISYIVQYIEQLQVTHGTILLTVPLLVTHPIIPIITLVPITRSRGEPHAMIMKTPCLSLLLYYLSRTVAFTAAAEDNTGGPRIVGGSFVKADTYPWFTMLGFNFYDSFWRQKCGGALVSPEWVLTAAHCIDDQIRNNGAVIVGAFQAPYTETDNGGQYMESLSVKAVVEHPKYDSSTYDNDFALLRLNEKSTITPVAMDSEHISDLYKTGEKEYNFLHYKIVSFFLHIYIYMCIIVVNTDV